VFLVRIVPYKTSENIIDGVIVSIIDISEMSKAKKLLEIQQLLVSEAEKVAKIGVWEFEFENQKFNINKFLKNLMLTEIPENLNLEKLINYFDDGDADLIRNSFMNLSQNKIDIEVSGKNHHIYKITGAQSKNNSKKANGILQDITAEKELNIRYKSVLETMADGFFVIETNTGKFLDANNSFCMLTGYSKAELLKMSIFQIDKKQSKKISLSDLKKLKEFGTDQYETVHTRKDGSCYDAAIKIKHNNLFPNLMFGFCENITPRKNWELKLKDKNTELQKINQELDTFVYRTSHDLRAPLASSLGLIELLKLESSESEEISKLINLQEKALNSMDEFIMDILTYSRNIRLETKREKINLLETAEETFKLLSNLKNYPKINKDITSNCASEIYSDLFRIKIILNNLFSNAIKFADLSKETPSIKLILNCTKKYFEIKLIDNGIGDEHKSKVFEIFYRATQNVEGTGVGMFIVKDSVEKLNGSVSFTSKLGEGTTFVVKLPNMKD